MALVTPVRTLIDTDPGCELWTWTLTSADHTGVAIRQPAYADTCWHVKGDFGSTGVAAVQGSNTDVEADFGAVTNVSGGSAITWSAAGAPKQAIERPLFMRPKLTTVGTLATLVVTALIRKQPGK